MAMQHRADTAANWTSTNPYLALGEIGFETDTGKLKIGNGKDRWSVRPYHNPRSGVELLDHTTLSVDTAQVDITVPERDEIVKLEIWIRGRSSAGSDNDSVYLRADGSTALLYDDQHLYGAGATAAAFSQRAQSRLTIGLLPGNTAEANQWASTIIEIPFPRKVGPWRTFASRSGFGRSTVSGMLQCRVINGWFRKGGKIGFVRILTGANLMAETQIATFAWVDK